MNSVFLRKSESDGKVPVIISKFYNYEVNDMSADLNEVLDTEFVSPVFLHESKLPTKEVTTGIRDVLESRYKENNIKQPSAGFFECSLKRMTASVLELMDGNAELTPKQTKLILHQLDTAAKVAANMDPGLGYPTTPEIELFENETAMKIATYINTPRSSDWKRPEE